MRPDPRPPRPRPLTALALLLAGAGVVVAGSAWRAVARASRVALSAPADLDGPAPPARALADGAPCAVAELARVAGRVTAVLAASDGALHVGTSEGGVVRLAPAEAGDEDEDGADPSPTALALAGRERAVNALAEHEGLVWAATRAGAVAFDAERRVVALLPSEEVLALEVAGTALYAGTERGVFRLSVAGGAEAVEARGPEGEPLRVSALAASGGTLWIGTAAGLYALPLAIAEAPLLARTARRIPLDAGDPPATTNAVTALAALGSGVVAGTEDGGLVQVPADGPVRAVRFTLPSANAVSPGAAAAVPGGVAFGTPGGVLLARAEGGGLAVARVAPASASALRADAAGEGRLLLGTPDGAVLGATCGLEVPRAPGAAAGAAGPAPRVAGLRHATDAPRAAWRAARPRRRS